MVWTIPLHFSHVFNSRNLRIWNFLIKLAMPLKTSYSIKHSGKVQGDDKNPGKLKASILKVLNRYGCCMMHISRNTSMFFWSRNVRSDHFLLSIQNINNFPWFCKILSKYLWYYLQLYAWFLSVSNAVREETMNFDRLSIQELATLVEILTSWNGEARRSTILLEIGFIRFSQSSENA